MLEIGKFSMGVGDRFGHEGTAQLRAFLMARARGVEVVPVWNKSHREHTMVNTVPQSVRREADLATAALGWGAAYHVDADHIGLATVEPFLDASDFFTLDVADFLGKGVESADARGFANKHVALVGEIQIPGIDDPLHLSRDRLEDIARAVLPGVREAGRIYRRIARSRGEGTFITEVSMDEADAPQSPEILLVILVAIADEGIPAQTIAPRFSGHFHKGVDYVGDVAAFAEEVDRALCIIRFAQRELGLPSTLKLSLHSGSDKFSLYGPLRRAMRRRDVGLHLKTAGTTWLEEIIGLCEGGDDGLQIAKDIYAGALARVDELCLPYATVIDIDPSRLPPAEVVARWDGEEFIAALRHDPSSPRYNPHLRQLLHVAYKLAAEMGDRFLSALDRHHTTIARNVTENIYQRHLVPVFLDEGP